MSTISPKTIRKVEKIRDLIISLRASLEDDLKITPTIIIINDDIATSITKIENDVKDIKHMFIQCEIEMCRKSKDVARRWGFSPARLSQIAPRK